MRQAITTKFLGPTNHRGARIKVMADAQTMIVQWDHGMGRERNHIDAAWRLARKLGWHGQWVYGGIGDGCVFVQAEDSFEVQP